MLTPKPSLSEAIKAYTAERRQRLGEDAPSLAELQKYQAGELSSQDARRVATHVVFSPETSRAALDLAAFPEVVPVDEEQVLSDDEKAADWQRFKKRLEAAGLGFQEAAPGSPIAAREPAVVEPILRSSPAVGWRSRALYAMAVAWLLTVLGLGFWIVQLRQEAARPVSGSIELASKGEPAAIPLRQDLFLHNLSPLGTSTTRDWQAIEPLHVPADMEHLVLLLNLADLRRFTDYQLDLRAVDGRQVATARGLARLPEGNFSIELPRDAVAPGGYEIHLFGIEDGDRVSLATYRFVISDLSQS